MASSSRSAATPQSVDITALKTEIYEACAPLSKENPKIVFHQTDILDLDIIPNNDVNVLLAVAQGLLNDKLFKVVHDGDGMGWKLRTADEAKKYKNLTSEQEIVYSLIDEAGEDGAWSKTIKAKTNLHDAVFTSAIKHLESKRMITSMKSVEHPTRKMYIKASLRPSERATGGPWFSDGELDEEFINTGMLVLYTYIQKRTFYVSKSHRERHSSPKMPRKVVRKLSPEEVKASRDKALGPRPKKQEQQPDKKDFGDLLPMPAGYQGYPTIHDLTLYIEESPFFNQTLTSGEVQQLLDVMIYDNRIEKVLTGADGVSYRVLRQSLIDEDERGSVMTEVPCGRCPVFDLCEEGGPVGPSNCEYFNDWLNM